jgi:hypothetical protein
VPENPIGGKMATHKASVNDKIITGLDGRLISSLPKSKRAAARKAVEEQRKKHVWTDANVDPNEQRHLAHRVANSRHRGHPTRSADKKRGIDDSRM